MRLLNKIKLAAIAILCFSLGCAKLESATPSSSTRSQGVEVITYKHEPLSWETTSHPERRNWSLALLEIVDERYEDLDRATDVASFCPTYRSLTRDEKINVWAEIFSNVTYYECSWRPESFSVDVGTADNRDTWSVGLLQLSVVDQANHGFRFGFNFTDLQDPIKNLQLGVAIMAKQITKYGVILIPKGGRGLYWAVLHPGGKYDKSVAIQNKTKMLDLCR